MNTDAHRNVVNDPILNRTGDHFNPLAGTNDSKKPHSSLFGNFGRNPNVATEADGINTVVGGATAAQTGHEHHHGLTGNVQHGGTNFVAEAGRGGYGSGAGGVGSGVGGQSGRPAGMSDAEYQAGYQKALDEARLAQQQQHQPRQATSTSTPTSTSTRANEYKEGYQSGISSHNTHDHASHPHSHSHVNTTPRDYSSNTNTGSGLSRVDAIENKGEKILGGTGLHHDSNHPGHGGPDEVVAGNFGGAGGVQQERLLNTRNNVVYEEK